MTARPSTGGKEFGTTAHTAVSLGYAETTMPEGVNKWHNEYDEFFRGADVVIVSDNDPQAKDPKTSAPQFHRNGKPVLPGQDHAAKVAWHLRKVAAHVRTVIFPQKDLTAWREAGGTKAALDALIEAAPDQIKQSEPVDENENEEILAEMNRDNCVVLDHARTMVLRFESELHQAGGERYIYQVPTFLKFDDFRNLYLNRRLNLWRGWGIEPKLGEWPLLREHIFEVLAARDDDMDDYIFRWLAWAVQHPAERAEVALVFRGLGGAAEKAHSEIQCAGSLDSTPATSARQST